MTNTSIESLQKKIDEQTKELARIKNIANCGTVDSWLLLTDDQKREWFAASLIADSTKSKIITELTFLLEDCEKTLEDVVEFITNGCEYKFIRMPDTNSNDPALNTLPNVLRLIKNIDSFLNNT